MSRKKYSFLPWLFFDPGQYFTTNGFSLTLNGVVIPASMSLTGFLCVPGRGFPVREAPLFSCLWRAFGAGIFLPQRFTEIYSQRYTERLRCFLVCFDFLLRGTEGRLRRGIFFTTEDTKGFLHRGHKGFCGAFFCGTSLLRYTEGLLRKLRRCFR